MIFRFFFFILNTFLFVFLFFPLFIKRLCLLFVAPNGCALHTEQFFPPVDIQDNDRPCLFFNRTAVGAMWVIKLRHRYAGRTSTLVCSTVVLDVCQELRSSESQAEK